MKKRVLLFTSFCFLAAAVAMAAETPAKPVQASGTGNKPASATVTAPRVYTIAELYKNAPELHKKTVSVHGRVVKVTSGIKGKTWTHVQDGSGDKAKGTNDLIGISAKDRAEVGEVVTMTGTLMYNPEIRYTVVLEDATIRK